MINVAVVGLGFMGVTHLKAYRKLKDVRIAAICDAIKLPTDGVLAGVAGNVADPDPVCLDMTQVRAYKDFNELLADKGVDLIDLCVPTPLHVKLAVAALGAGRHVVCEKPLARTSAQAREIAGAAAQAKGFFLPAMCMRFWPGWSWLKPAVADQRHGRVLAARFRRVSEPPGWAKGSYFKGDESGGALLDLHIHDTDFVQFVFGRPKAVFSTGLTRYSGAIDHVVTQYEVEAGATVSAEGSWLMTPGWGFNMSYTVNFERATADFDSARGADALKLTEEGQPTRTVPLEAGDGYERELGHMIASIQSSLAPTIVTASDAVSAVEICEAEEKSVALGQKVML